MPESPDIPEDITAKIRLVMPYSLPSQEQLLPGQQADPDRNVPMPYQRPEGLLPIPGPDDERGFAVTPVVGSTSGTIGSFVGQVSVSPDTLLNDFPAGMDGQTPILRSVSDSTKIYAHATVNGAGVVTARAITAGASVPADDPKTGDFYWELASVTMATDGADNVPVITVDQIRWGPIEELQRYFREFHIQPSGANRAIVFNGTLFGSLPTGFSVDNSPFFELTSLANGDKIYAAITWDRRVLANGNIVGTITSRTIAKAASVPSNNELTATRYYQLATVTLGAGNIPVIAQSRWGPIDDLPGTATSPYLMPPSPGDQADAQTDYYDLTVTGKGKDTAAADLAPTYDSVQMNKTGFVRFVTEDGDLKAFVRPATINSIGQITFTGPEDLAVDFPPLTFEFGTLGYTGGTPGGTITGTWNDGFTLDLLLPYTVFGTVVTLSPGSSASVSGQGIAGDPLIFSIPRGDAGEDGNTVLYGAAAPTTEGVDGNFYIRTTTNYIYGPKAAGVWPAGTSLVGPTGPAGGPLSMHTIGGSNFDGTQDVTSFPSPGAIGGTTPDAITGTTATFGAGYFTVDADGDCVAASFATYGGGYCTLRGDGTASFYNGAITLGDDTGTDAWIDSDGSASFGSGGCTINSIGATEVYSLNVESGQHVLNDANNKARLGVDGIAFKNIRHGTSAAMVAGVVSVTDGACTSASLYFFTVNSIGTVANPSTYRVTARTASTSFTVTASDLTDTSTLDWFAIEP